MRFYYLYVYIFFLKILCTNYYIVFRAVKQKENQNKYTTALLYWLVPKRPALESNDIQCITQFM